MAETCAGHNQLAATFFFARTVAGRNAIQHLFPTIAVQIALSAPEKRRMLDKILSDEPYIAERASGPVDLVASLFQDCSQTNPSPLIVIIDGLDECQGHKDQRRILTEVSHMISTHHLPLRFVIVSRPESHLCDAFEEPPLVTITENLSLYDDFGARADVSSYLRSEFSRIHESKRYKYVMQFVPIPWPSKRAIDRLVSKSGGYFIYASTVIRFIDEEGLSPIDRLAQVLNTNPLISPPDSSPLAELDKLYFQILSSCPKSNLAKLKRVLAYVVVLPTTTQWADKVDLDINAIEAFLRLPRGQVKLMLQGLRSLLSFGESLGDVRLPKLHHASFGDFLLDKERSKDYHVDSEEWRYTAFCDAFSLACKMLGLSEDPVSDSTSRYDKGLLVTFSSLLSKSGRKLTYLPLVEYDGWFLDGIIQFLSRFIWECLHDSSKKDRLIEVVRPSIEKGIWYPCLQDLDNWSDWKMFAGLEILTTIGYCEDEVLNHLSLFLDFTPDIMLVLHTV